MLGQGDPYSLRSTHVAPCSGIPKCIWKAAAWSSVAWRRGLFQDKVIKWGNSPSLKEAARHPLSRPFIRSGVN